MITRDGLKRMSAAEIVEARRAGELEHLLSGKAAPAQPSGADHGPRCERSNGRLFHDFLRRMTPAQIFEARRDADFWNGLMDERRRGVR